MSEYDDAINTISNTRGAIYDWMIVDHYELSGIWEEATETYIFLVFDDLADEIINAQFWLIKIWVEIPRTIGGY